MQWFANLSVKIKIMLLIVLLTLVAVTVGTLGARGAGEINDAADRLYEKELLGLSYIGEANIHVIYIVSDRKPRFLASVPP